jgi:anti-sigma factor RsiW
MGSHVVMELLAYLDGELSDRERARVEAHLAECSRCTAELEQLRMLRRELDATFDAALSPVRLPAAADARIRDRLRARTGPRPLWRLWQRRGLVAQALLAVCVLVFVFATQQTISPPLPAGPQETLVIGQDRLAPGSQAALRVLVHTAAEAAAPAAPIEGAEIVVRIGRTPGLASIAYTGRTDANGTAEVAFTVPEDLEGEASLVIETSSAGGEDRIVRPITITRD